MAPSYLSLVGDKNYIGNVVVRLNGQYFCIRQPDSGLSVPAAYRGTVQSVVISPTQIDLRRVSSTIGNFSFKLVDQGQVVSQMIGGDASSLLDASVDIWVGRSDVGMDFADYYALPQSRLKKIDYADGVYSFSTQEQTERLNRALFQTSTTLDVDILAVTSVIDLASVADIPDSGLVKIESELISYTGRDLAEKRITGCIRGEHGTTPAAHAINSPVYLVERVVANPLDVLLHVLISGSGQGSSHDTLYDGCGFTETEVDYWGIISLKDSDFSSLTIEAYLYQINGLKWLEEEILTPLSLRFSVSSDAKLTVKVMDRLAVIPSGREITHETIKSPPKWTVDASRIVNRLEVSWDYSEAQGKYLQTSTFRDEDSITKYGEKDKLSFKFATIRADMEGLEWLQDFARKTLRRLSTPTPEISLTTHIDKSIYGPVDRVSITSDRIPAYDGSLNFSSQLEIVSRSINYMNGEVGFRLAFVGNTMNRLGFIAPSPMAQPRLVSSGGGKGGGPVTFSVLNQTDLVLLDLPGEDTCRVGWKVQLWLTQKSPKNGYIAPPIGEATLFDAGVYEVISIDYKTITLDRPISSTMTVDHVYAIRFPIYSLCSEDQKRFAFVSLNGAKFPDDKAGYTITY